MKRLIICASFVFATPALAEDVEGVVKVVGSALSRKVMIYSADSQKHKLCRNDESKRISRLTGMTVKVSGDWQMKQEKKNCLSASSFVVNKVSSGRDAVVGTLSQTATGFEVKTDDGKVHILSKVPSGLKKLAGEKVIIDVKPMNSPTSQSAAYNVVTYSKFP